MTTDPSFATPTAAQVNQVLARLGNLQHRRAFYSKLENPNWVRALNAAHAFDNPPTLTPGPDGTVRAELWPEADFLVRMAALAPDDVASVFAKVIATDHPLIRRAIVDGASIMPVTDSAPLASPIAAWADSPYVGYLDFRSLARLIVNLLQSQHRKKGMKLAFAFYQPREPKTDARFGQSEPYVPVDDYDYDATLPAVAEAMGDGAIGTVGRWLEEYEVKSGAFHPESPYDLSYIWRPDIASVRGHRNEYKDTLVDVVRAAAVRAILADPSRAPAGLLRSQHPLLHRIALDALAQVLEETAAEGARLSPELASAATEYLKHDGHSADNLRVEYVRLIRACGLFKGAIDLGTLVDVVNQGPNFSEEDYVAFRLELDPDADEAEVREDAKDETARRRHLLLSQIGAPLLPRELGEQLAELDNLLGPIENPGPHNFGVVTSWRRPDDPASIGLTGEMSDEELVKFIQAWTPPPDSFGWPPDLSQAISSFITEHPSRFSDGIPLLAQLAPAHLSAVVNGWTSAARAGQTVPWTAALAASAQLLALDDGNPESHYVDSAAVEVGRLWLEAVGKHQPTSTEPLATELVLPIAKLLAEITYLPKREAAESDHSTDYLTQSLNQARSIAVRALIPILGWDELADVHNIVLAAFERLLRERPRDLVVAAALGEGIAWLYNHAESWVESNSSLLFGTETELDQFQQVALSTALARHEPHEALLAVMRPGMLAAAKRADDQQLTVGWQNQESFKQLIGHWVIHGIIRGFLDYEDPLATAFFEGASPAVRAETMGDIAWSMTRGEGIAPIIVERTKQLWDRRAEHVREHPEDAEELGQFYWLARCPEFEVGWWLPRLVAAAQAYDRFDPKGMLSEALIAAAEPDPDQALAALEALLAHRDPDNHWDRYDITQNAAPGVLAHALDSNDKAVHTRAAKLMGQLGAEGDIDLKSKVDARRYGHS